MRFTWDKKTNRTTPDDIGVGANEIALKERDIIDHPCGCTKYLGALLGTLDLAGLGTRLEGSH